MSTRTNTFPPGIPYIIGNEAAERFSYYGMKCILVVFMTQYLKSSDGALLPMDEADARGWYHLFSAANYFFPLLGALIADIFWGKYKTILRLSILYCLGHFVLALFETRTGLAVGLMFIAIGSGGIKPCVSAHVGDQFSNSTQHLVERVFSYFYFSINLGAFVSTLLTPYLLSRYGPSLAFGIPGLLMLIATVLFWEGREVFIAIPPAGISLYREALSNKAHRRSLRQLLLLYLFISVFWALFDQTGSSWVLQAQKMDRTLFFGSITVLPSQIQAANPVLVMILIPLFSFLLYPAIEKRSRFTPLRKMVVGMMLTALSFVVIGIAEMEIQSGASVSIAWQLVAYTILTAGEVMVSITALEYSYTQAPLQMKSLVMGLFYLSVTLGNLLAAGVNFLVSAGDEYWFLQAEFYYLFFALLMFLTGILLSVFGAQFQETTYLHLKEP